MDMTWVPNWENSRQHNLPQGFHLFPQTKGLGNAGTGNIGIEDSGVVALPLHTDCQQTGNQRFADAAFAADNANDLFDLTDLI